MSNPRQSKFLVQVCMGHGWGGPHMYLLRVAEEAESRGFKAIVAANSGSELEHRASKAGFETLGVAPDDRGKFWPKLLKMQRRGRVHSVHLHSIRGLPRGFIGLPSDIQMVLTEHSYRFREVLHPLSRMALSRVDVVLATSEAIADVNGRALGINPERMRILHHGVDLRRFHPVSRSKERRNARENLGLSERDLVVVVPTTFRREKNLTAMIGAIARLRDKYQNLRLLLTGNFSGNQESLELRRELEAQIEEHSLRARVQFTGFLEHIEEVYAASDIVCVPTAFEAFGLPAVEAMGSGLPVIGSDKGAFPEIVEEGETGFCVDVSDLDAWETALDKLLSDRHVRERMGEAGRARAAAEFAISDHWTRLFAIYEEGRRRIARVG